jgi:hypothetical protein
LFDNRELLFRQQRLVAHPGQERTQVHPPLGAELLAGRHSSPGSAGQAPAPASPLGLAVAVKSSKLGHGYLMKLQADTPVASWAS